MTSALAVGVMSGTSLDGVSTALVRLADDPPALDAQLVAFRQDAYTAPERGQIIETIARGSSKDLALLHVALGERFAGAVLQLLAHAKVAPRDLSFVASHGQTIWHEPGRATLQLGDAAVMAERLGVRVVSDFRSRDVAAGGQGAPLVPLADVLLFGHPERGRLLLNIGGMANVTFVPRRGVTSGAVAFDTGPGVAVVDAVTRRIDPAAAFDAGGERARRGKPSRKVLDSLLADEYFTTPPFPAPIRCTITSLSVPTGTSSMRARAGLVPATIRWVASGRAFLFSSRRRRRKTCSEEEPCFSDRLRHGRGNLRTSSAR